MAKKSKAIEYREENEHIRRLNRFIRVTSALAAILSFISFLLGGGSEGYEAWIFCLIIPGVLMLNDRINYMIFGSMARMLRNDDETIRRLRKIEKQLAVQNKLLKSALANKEQKASDNLLEQSALEEIENFEEDQEDETSVEE
jgi:hypothetical protein